ncbi:hypothetical protein BH11PSE3_BH11PSE3_16430 [soil metagenome]
MTEAIFIYEPSQPWKSADRVRSSVASFVAFKGTSRRPFSAAAEPAHWVPHAEVDTRPKKHAGQVASQCLLSVNLRSR